MGMSGQGTPGVIHSVDGIRFAANSHVANLDQYAYIWPEVSRTSESMNKAMLKATALAGALALVPATTAALAEAEGNSYRTLDEFMDVFQRVRSDYVDKVDDETLIKGDRKSTRLNSSH